MGPVSCRRDFSLIFNLLCILLLFIINIYSFLLYLRHSIIIYDAIMDRKYRKILSSLEKTARAVFRDRYEGRVTDLMTKVSITNEGYVDFMIYYNTVSHFVDWFKERIPDGLRDFVIVKTPKVRLYVITEVILNDSIYLIVSILHAKIFVLRYDLKEKIIYYNTGIIEFIIEMYGSKCEYGNVDFFDVVSFLRLFCIEDRMYNVLEGILCENYCFGDMGRKQIERNKKVYTYIIEWKGKGLYKIGKSVDIESRFKTLSSSNNEISILAFLDKNIEAELHRKYEIRRRFGEWFKFSEKEVDDIIKDNGFVRY